MLDIVPKPIGFKRVLSTFFWGIFGGFLGRFLADFWPFFGVFGSGGVISTSNLTRGPRTNRVRHG